MDKDIAIRIARMFFSSLVFGVSSQGRGLVLPSSWSARYVAPGDIQIHVGQWHGTGQNAVCRIQ